MWNFSRLLFRKQMRRRQANEEKQLQHESMRACRLVKINFLYLTRFCLISTLTTSDLVNECFFLDNNWCSRTMVSASSSSTVLTNDRLDLIFLTAFSALPMTLVLKSKASPKKFSTLSCYLVTPFCYSDFVFFIPKLMTGGTCTTSSQLTFIYLSDYRLAVSVMKPL